MAEKSPKSVEVMDLQFKLHGKTKIFNVNQTNNDKSNLLAVSSAQGLLFAGDPEQPQLKVFMTKNITDSGCRASNMFVRIVPLPERPIALACSCDGSLLGVNYLQNGTSFLHIFNVASLLTTNISSQCKIPLSADANAACQQILWNPVISANLAVILKNGGLSMYTLKDGGHYEMHNLDKNHQVQCGCWSPKGKQIVLGFANGKLQQFKPELTAAKTIVCPVGIHPGPFSTIAVHWLSTYQFAVAFLQDGAENVPSLYIVNAPKGGSAVYINYFDVCYTTGQRQHQITFTHIQQWNLLLVASANGIEVGLLGCRDSSGDTPTWVQYTLLDEARIEMPLTNQDEETFPIGFSLDTSCSHHLTVNDNQLPVMPMIHVLSTSGIFLCFNLLNLTPSAANICSPPPPLSFSTEIFQLLSEILAQSNESAPRTDVKDNSVMPPNLIASTPLVKEKPSPFFGGTALPAAQQPFEQLPKFGNLKTATIPADSAFKPNAPSGMGGVFNASNTLSGLTFAGLGGQQQQTSQASLQSKPQLQPQIQQQQQQQQPQEQKQVQQPTSVVGSVKSSELNKPLYTVPTNFMPPNSTAVDGQPAAPLQKSQSNTLISNKMQAGFLELISVQINSFDKEIKQSVNHSKDLLKNIGSPDEMRACTKRLNDLDEIINQANNHDFEMDVQSLRHSLKEARFMVSECRWKLDKHKNPDLPRLGNSTSDGANRRQLAKLQSNLSANEAQMQLLKHLIDVQWSNFQDTVRRNTKSQVHIPCLDGIYQRMTKMQEILVRQRSKIDHIKSKLQRNGMLHRKILSGENSFTNGKQEITMESLADSILSMTLAQVVDEERAKLSSEKLNAIREFARQRKTVNIIKPHRPNRVGLRSEVVLETMLQSERSKMLETTTSINVSQKNKETSKGSLLSTPTVTKSLPLTPSPSFSFGNSTSFVKTAPMSNQFQQSSTALSFKPSTPSSGFVVPNSNTTTTAGVDMSKTAFSTPEGEVPKIPQSPISFAAKVIGGPGTANKQNTNAKAVSAGMDQKKPEELANKPLLFASKPGAPNLFSGITLTSSANAAANLKPNLIDSKSSTNLGFSGFNVTKSDATIAAAPPPGIGIFLAPKPETGEVLFSGFGKSVGIEKSSTITFSNTPQIPISVSKPSLVSDPPTTASKATTATTLSTPSTISGSIPSKDPADALLGELTICKPTNTSADTTKPPSNIFSGFGSGSSIFSYTPATSNGSFSFGNLSKSIATTAAATAQPTDLKATVTTTTSSASAVSIGKEVTASTTTATLAPTTTTTKDTEFTFNLSSFGTTVSPVSASPANSNKSAVTPQPENLSLKTTVSNAAPSTTATATTAPPTGFFTAVTSSGGVSPSSTPSSIFGSIALGAVNTTTTAVSVVSSSVTTPSSTGIFASVAKPALGTPATESTGGGGVFASSQLPATAATTLTSSFGSFSVAPNITAANTATTGSIFGNAAATVSSGNNIFGNVPKPDASAFVSSTTASNTGLFASALQSAPPFGAAATSPPPNQTVTGGGIFGSSFSFANPAGTGSIFGGGTTASAATVTSAAPPAGGSIFGKAAEAGGGIFSGGVNQQASATGGGSIFGQNIFNSPASPAATPPSGLFASAAPTDQPSFGSGASLFGSANTSGTSGGPIFGAAAPVLTSSFGSPSGTTGSTGFGAFSQTGAGSPFSSPNNANTGPFGQTAPSVAQSGFGSPQQASAFSKPIFGGPATFGSPPAFGAQPTFGGAPTFGPQKSAFGSFASAATTSPTSGGVFGATSQQNNPFETLGSTDTGISFANLAQGAGGNAPKPTFGGSSFTSYRS